MEEVFAITLASMQADVARLDRAALNLANVSTPAYKREVVAISPFAQVLEDTRGAQRVSGADSAGEDPRSTRAAIQIMTDTRPGSLRVTGHAFDLALTGDAFFEVSTAEGAAYTRQGSFRLDARGRLVTAQGDPVMGRTGEIFLSTQTPVVDAEGRISEPDAATGLSSAEPGRGAAQLKLVRFEDPHSLERLGEGLVAPGNDMTEVAAGEGLVRQGSLENANVSSMQEMVQLMVTMRHFESMQRVAQGYDEMLGTAIRKLGDLT